MKGTSPPGQWVNSLMSTPVCKTVTMRHVYLLHLPCIIVGGGVPAPLLRMFWNEMFCLQFECVAGRIFHIANINQVTQIGRQ